MKRKGIKKKNGRRKTKRVPEATRKRQAGLKSRHQDVRRLDDRTVKKLTVDELENS
jgi:hypothetical protein